LGKGPLTLELGFKGCIREHLGRVFPFAAHVWQLSPASHLLSDPQVSPICYLGLSHNNIKNKSNVLLLEIRNSAFIRKTTLEADEQVNRQNAISTSCGRKSRIPMLLCSLCRKWNIIWIFDTH